MQVIHYYDPVGPREKNSERPLPDISIVLAYSSIHFIFIRFLLTRGDLNTQQMRQAY